MDRRPRQPARRLLEESEQRYRSLFEHNPDAVFVLDRQPRFTSANPAAERVSGYLLPELSTLSPMTLIAPEDRDRTAARFTRALAGEPSSDELAIIARDGRRVELSLTLVPMVVGDAITGVFGMARDITVRHRIEAERADLLVREQEARSRAELAEGRAAFLADAGELLTASLDYETTLVSLTRLLVPGLADWCAIDILDENGSLRRLVSAVEPGLQQRISQLLQQHTPDRGTAMGSRWQMRVIKSGRPEFAPVVTPEMIVSTAVGDEIARLLQALEISSYMRVPLTARGHTLGAITFAYAASGRRYTEADLSLAMELARRAALSVDNARLYQDAQQAIALRDQFLATASHDLRTPVTSIKGHAQLLRRSVSRATQANGGLTERADDLLEGLQSIKNAASRITAQIDELLDLTRLQTGRPLELRRLPTDLVALAESVALAHQRLSDRHQIRIETAEPELMGLWDSIRLERVLNNLLSNALKYSPEGGEIVIGIRRESQPEGDTATLTVQDHGIGIPRADLTHIFERFYRAANVTGHPGSGIGLAGVRDIIRQHGGSIDVVSEEGSGAVFTVQLPIAPAGLADLNDE